MSLANGRRRDQRASITCPKCGTAAIDIRRVIETTVLTAACALAAAFLLRRLTPHLAGNPFAIAAVAFAVAMAFGLLIDLDRRHHCPPVGSSRVPPQRDRATVVPDWAAQAPAAVELPAPAPLIVPIALEPFLTERSLDDAQCERCGAIGAAVVAHGPCPNCSETVPPSPRRVVLHSSTEVNHGI